jgi:hypothetical protein
VQRPTFLTVFAILNFVFAVFGVIGLIASFALFSVPANSNNSVIKLIPLGPVYTIWLKACIPLGLLNCAALLADGIGLLCLKPWARSLAIIYAIYAIVFTLFGMALNLIVMVQPILEQARQQREFETVGAIGGPISGTIGGFFWLIYPMVLLVFMLRPKVLAAFQRTTSPQTQATSPI